MNITRRALVKVIREEIAKSRLGEDISRGIEEYRIRDIATHVMERAHDLIIDYAGQHAVSEEHRRDILQSASETLASIEDSVYALLYDKLGAYVRYV